MFAVLALITFLLALFGVHIGAINLVTLGLAFLAAHMIWDPFPLTGIQLHRRDV
jgi:hypothetical protein